MLEKIKPNKNLGQNFLINTYTINTIIDILNISENDYVIEVGPGTGALTDHLIKKTKNYIGIEKDLNLCNFLRIKYKNKIDIRNDNILKIDLNNIYKEKYKFIGNIPYNISTKLLMNCIKKRKNFSDIHFMLQKDFADRIISKHGNKIFGRLSVFIQLFFETEKFIDIAPFDFYPEPKVYSSFLRLIPIENILLDDNEINSFLNFIHIIFNTRRKKIKNCLNVDCNNLYDNMDKRAEELSIEQMIKLFRNLKNDRKFI